MARKTSGRRTVAAGSARGLTDAMLAELIDGTRASLDRAHGEAEAKYAAALAELELEAVRRGLELPSPGDGDRQRRQQDVDRPEDNIPPIELALFAGSEEKVIQVLSTVGPDALHHAWQVARTIPEPPLRLLRLTLLCLVLDRRVFGEETAEQRHRSYALYPGGVESRLQLVNDAIAATFSLLRLRMLG